MVNLVITSTTDLIKVVFNDFSTAANMKKGTWRKDKILGISLSNDETLVEVDTLDGTSWDLSYGAGSFTMIIDSINGVAPTSNSDLYDKLVAIIE